MALPAFVWVKIQAAAVEVDRRLEVFGVAETAGGLLDPLDDGVDTLEPGVGEVMAQVGQQVRQVTLDELGDRRHGREPAMGGAPEPTGEERGGHAGVAVLPEGAEALLEGPGPADLEVLPLQGAERGPLRLAQILGPAQPQVLGARQAFIANALEGPVLAAPHPIDGLVQMFDDVELVEHDLLVRFGQVRARRLHVGLPLAAMTLKVCLL